MLSVAGAVSGATYGAIVGDVAGQARKVVGAALIQVPAVWVVVGVAMALFGLLPRLTSVSWGVLVVSLLLGQLGQILQFPQWSLEPVTVQSHPQVAHRRIRDRPFGRPDRDSDGSDRGRPARLPAS